MPKFDINTGITQGPVWSPQQGQQKTQNANSFAQQFAKNNKISPLAQQNMRSNMGAVSTGFGREQSFQNSQHMLNALRSQSQALPRFGNVLAGQYGIGKGLQNASIGAQWNPLMAMLRALL